MEVNSLKEQAEIHYEQKIGYCRQALIVCTKVKKTTNDHLPVITTNPI